MESGYIQLSCRISATKRRRGRGSGAGYLDKDTQAKRTGDTLKPTVTGDDRWGRSGGDRSGLGDVSDLQPNPSKWRGRGQGDPVATNGEGGGSPMAVVDSDEELGEDVNGSNHAGAHAAIWQHGHHPLINLTVTYKFLHSIKNSMGSHMVSR